MRKDQLIRALTVTRSSRIRESKKATKQSTAAAQGRLIEEAIGQRARNPRSPRSIRRRPPQVPRHRDAAHARSRLPERPDHRSGPRFLLAARLLGAEPDHAGPRSGRAGQEWHSAQPILRLMDVTSEDTTAAVRAPRSRHPHPRRRQQLVHRRPGASPLVPDRHRLSVAPRQVLRPGAVEHRHDPEGRRHRRSRRELDHGAGAVRARSEPVDHRLQSGHLDARPARALRGAAAPAALQRLDAESLGQRAAALGRNSTSRSTPS